MEALLRPWRYEFFVNGMIAATLVGALCGLIGVFVVLRHMSYIGHGLSHAIFGGAVVSYILQWNFYLGAGLWGFIAALLINATARKRQIGADAAIGVITTASFAIGVALISKVRRFTKNFEAALFGNILGVTPTDLWIIAGVFIFTIVVFFFAYKQLLFTTFDPDVAPTYGVSSQWIEALFAFVLAAALIASMQVMGVTLIAAALVIPAVIARLITDSFAKLLLLTTLIGASCGTIGMYVSFYADVASGATIVLTAAALFVVAIAISSLQQRRRGMRLGVDASPVLSAHGDSHLF